MSKLAEARARILVLKGGRVFKTIIVEFCNPACFNKDTDVKNQTRKLCLRTVFVSGFSASSAEILHNCVLQLSLLRKNCLGTVFVSVLGGVRGGTRSLEKRGLGGGPQPTFVSEKLARI